MEENKKVDNIDEVTVSTKVLSDLIGVSDRRIRNLENEGIIVKKARGRYSLKDSIKNYIKNLKINKNLKNNDVQPGELDLNQERAKYEVVKRKQAELKLALMNGELYKGKDVEFVMNDMLSNCRSKILNIPSKLTPLLVNVNDIDYIKKIITREINEVLSELKDYNPEDFRSDEFINSLLGEDEDV